MSRGSNGRCVIFCVVDDRVHRYTADEVELNPERIVDKEHPAPAKVAFSGYLARHSYKKAEVLVRGTPEDLIVWLKRVEALRATEHS